MESQELVNLFAVAQAFEPIQLAHFMAAILPSSGRDRNQLLGHINALIPLLHRSDRFRRAFERLYTYPTLHDLMSELDRPTRDAKALQELFIDAIFELIWSGMADEKCTLKQIRNRMIILAAELIVNKFKSLSPRARKNWRFQDRATWVREELAKHNPRYVDLCTDSVLHREIIRIVTAQLQAEGLWCMAFRKRAQKKGESTPQKGKSVGECSEQSHPL